MDWNAWVADNAGDGGFLQSEQWGSFQQALGHRIEFLEVRSQKPELKSLVIEYRLPLGQSYVYSSRGPVTDENQESRIKNDGLDSLADEVKKRFPRALFWRIEPTQSYNLQPTSYKLSKAPRTIQPATVLVVDLNKTEEELLASSKPKTRYNIHLAQRHGVEVRRIMNNESALQRMFFSVMEETSGRDGFRLHPRAHYKIMLEHSVELWGALYQGELIAGALIAFFGHWAYYLHGASSNAHRNVMAPYALHCEIMNEARRRGAMHYDLGGASDDPGNSWAGVTRFKRGFVPTSPITQYPGTYDVLLHPWGYRLYRLAQTILRR